MPIVALPLLVVPPPPPARFAPPPWDHNSPDWLRLDRDLPADHLARRIDAAVDQLDLSALFASYAGTGSQACRPDLLLKVALFEIQRGHSAPGQWYRDLRENGPCQWLALGLRPARSRLYAFRDRLGAQLDQWHRQLLQQALAEGVTQARRASLDGTTVAANSSRHRLLHEATLAKRQEMLAQATAADEPRADPAIPALPPPATAAAADQPAAWPAWMATTRAGRVQQQERYRQLGEQLALRLAENQQRPASKRKASQAVRVSPGDPEAVLGLDKLKVYRPLYNVQLLADLDSPLVLTYEVFAQSGDSATLVPLLRRCQQATGRCPEKLLTDASYATALDLAACAEAEVTLYAPYQENTFSATKRAAKPARQLPKSAFTWVEEEQAYRCPQGQRLRLQEREAKKRQGGKTLQVYTYRCEAAQCQACPLRLPCTRSARGRTVKRSEHEGLVEQLQQRMQTEEAKQLYKQRGQTVELRFADGKEHRGLRQLSGRGLARAKIEVGLVVLAHNALGLLAARQEKAESQPLATRDRSTA